MRQISDKERQNRDELFRLMQENPDLPVIPFVNAEIVTGDDFGYWMGSWGFVKVDEILLPKDKYGWVVFKSDDDIFDTLGKVLSEKEFEALPTSFSECRKIYDALPWVKAIIVHIEPQNMF